MTVGKKLRFEVFKLPQAFKYLESAYLAGATIDELRDIALEAGSWTNWRETMEALEESLNA